jgi:hypothetical protein
MPLLIQIIPPEVTSLERQFVRQAMMEATSATYFGSPHTSISVTAGGGVVPPLPLAPIRATIVQIPTTSYSGTIPSTILTIVPFVQNVSNAPFSYGMPSFDSSSVLTYSTLQTIGFGGGEL